MSSLGTTLGLGLLLVFAAAPAMADAPAPAKPATKPATPASARQDYVPRPAMWLLEDADTRIYLFGTIHMLPADFRWRTSAFDAVVKRADELVVETYVPPEKEAEGPDLAMMAHFIASEPKPVAERVPARHREALARALTGVDMPREAFDIMQTWAVAFMLSIDQVYDSMGADDPDEAPGVEDQLEAVFRGVKKPIGSIEDGDKVIGEFFAYLSKMPEVEQSEFLVEAVLADPANGGDEDGLQDLHNWAKGRPEELAIEPGEDFPQAFYDMMLVRRNSAWTGWLFDRLERPGTVLVAVGAGHLTGKDSLQTMLAKRGFKVSRVQ